eukprot:m.340027 g.340027  ORF g.340027 m.340027 type:complete len:462 (+) comp19088_c0_seq1:165-1550(+)
MSTNPPIDGRPAWINKDGDSKEAFTIAITGGSASGKSTVAQRIVEEVGVSWVAHLSLDSFYKPLDEESLKKAHANEYDFDHPDALDIDLLRETLIQLRCGKRVSVPIYDFSRHNRSKETTVIYGVSVIVLEGLFVLDERLVDLIDVKVYVDETDETRLARRLKRDVAERGRSKEGSMKQYEKFVKPSFDKFIKPKMQIADVVVPRGIDNKVCMTYLIEDIRKQLRIRSIGIRKQLFDEIIADSIPDNVNLIPQTKQVHGLLTIIRDKESSREDFVFYSERLMRLLIEYANALLPHEEVTVNAHMGLPFSGCRIAKEVVGVSVLRSGLSMEASLRKIHQGIKLGKILIQTNPLTNEPTLQYLQLPDLVEKAIVILAPCIATGASILLSLRILLDHNAKIEDIIVVGLIGSKQGLYAIGTAFPKVRIVVAAIDENLSDRYRILPGLGKFGNRYFGCGQDTVKA